MERLTKKERLAGHTVNYVGIDNCFDVWSVPKKFMGNAIDRLAAYEDTGLEPEAVEHLKLASMGKAIAEIKEFDGIPIDRLRELVQADREGRCVVLPCKVGHKVKVDVRTWGNVWNYKTVENGKFLIGEIVAITKTKKQTLVKIRVEHNVSWKRPTRRYPASAIGKTVFLTCEEAEAAPEEKGNEIR